MESNYWRAVQTVQIKTFHAQTQAYVYAAAFHQAQLPHFLSNEHSSALMFPPMWAQGIGLHVRMQDRKLALELIKRLEAQENQPMDEDFREADLAEIQYQQDLHEAQMRAQNPSLGTWLLLILVIIWIGVIFLRG
jgi:hypothetical protein